jgi:hypothetical protein
MKTLDELVMAGKAKLKAEQADAIAVAEQARAEQKARRKEFWTNVRDALKDQWPEEFINQVFWSVFEELPIENTNPRLSIEMPGFAPISIELEVFENGKKVRLDHRGLGVPGVACMAPAMDEGEIYEGRVDWDWNDRRYANKFAHADLTTSDDVEVILALAAQRFEIYDQCLTKNAEKYIQLLAQKASEPLTKETEYVPVDAEDTTPLDGMNQALRALVYSLVDERMEMRA